MTDVVRVSTGGRWAYVAIDDSRRRQFSMLLDNGLAKGEGAEIRLRSEAGPLIRELSSQAPDPLGVLKFLSGDGIRVLGGVLSLGKKDGAQYNRAADISYQPGDGEAGLGAMTVVMPGDIVLSAWPASGRLIPGRILTNGFMRAIELAEEAPKGERCFVLSEDGAKLVTASMPRSSGRFAGLIRPATVAGWINLARDKARFVVVVSGKSFSIGDKKTGRKFYGLLRHGPEDGQRHELEVDGLKEELLEEGLSGVLGRYDLRRRE